MSRTKTFPLLLAAFAVMAIVLSCTDEPTAPPPITSHEFSWDVDTIDEYHNFSVRTIWGTDKNNVWVGGTRAGLNSALCRWNGEEWIYQDETVKQRKEIVAIDGVDSNFIVFAGWNQEVNPILITLDHGQWGSIPLPQPLRQVTALKVVSRDEMYVAGYDGLLQYKSGQWTWLLDSTNSVVEVWPQFVPAGLLYRHGSIWQMTVRHIRPNGTSKAYLMQKTGNIYSRVDSFGVDGIDEDSASFGMTFIETNDGIFSASTGGIFKLCSDSWIRIHNQPSYRMTGTSYNLFGGLRNKLMHFSGEDWKDITPPELQAVSHLLPLSTMFYIDGVLFLGVNAQGKSVVYRGKQKPE